MRGRALGNQPKHKATAPGVVSNLYSAEHLYRRVRCLCPLLRGLQRRASVPTEERIGLLGRCVFVPR
jgi:hypothetical protein